MPTRRPNLALLLLPGILALSGCTHNHYYYGENPLGVAGTPMVTSSPKVMASTSKPKKGQPVVVAGSYCDVPGVVSQPVVVSSNQPPRNSSTVVTRSAAPAPVIVASEPEVIGSDGWRRRSTENMATTRVSGSLNDDDLTR